VRPCQQVRIASRTQSARETFFAQPWHPKYRPPGNDKLTRDAARQVYEQAGVGPQDIQVVELHDCFAHNELLTYEGLDLCADGEAEKFVLDGDNTYGGRFVTNPSGGLLSKGHPLGRQAWPSAPSWSSSCAAPLTSGRSLAPDWRCSTTWAWVALASSRFTSASNAALLRRRRGCRGCALVRLDVEPMHPVGIASPRGGFGVTATIASAPAQGFQCRAVDAG
jgi:hypothetical protein